MNGPHSPAPSAGEMTARLAGTDAECTAGFTATGVTERRPRRVKPSGFMDFFSSGRWGLMDESRLRSRADRGVPQADRWDHAASVSDCTH